MQIDNKWRFEQMPDAFETQMNEIILTLGFTLILFKHKIINSMDFLNERPPSKTRELARLYF